MVHIFFLLCLDERMTETDNDYITENDHKCIKGNMDEQTFCEYCMAIHSGIVPYQLKILFIGTKSELEL